MRVMTREEAERFAQSEANMLRNRVYIQFVGTDEGTEWYSVAYSYMGNIDTPSYCDPEQPDVFSEPTWDDQLHHARKMLRHELHHHALVSLENNHRCEDCFCCAALTVLEERFPGLTRLKLYAMDGN